MLPAEVGIGVFAQIGKHRAVVHVMSVNHEVVADPGHTGLVNIGNAIIAVRFIKAALQIEVRLVRGLHNGVLCVESLGRKQMKDKIG